MLGIELLGIWIRYNVDPPFAEKTVFVFVYNNVLLSG